MREIAATSDFDFVASEPAPVAKKSRARGAKARGKTQSGAPPWISRLWTWRTPLFGGFAFVLLLAAIAVNAMFLQHGHHPAPLMGSTLRIEPAQAAPALQAQAAPAPALQAQAGSTQAQAGSTQAKAAPGQAGSQPNAALAAAEDVLAPVPLAKPQAVKPASIKAFAVPPASAASVKARLAASESAKSDAIGALITHEASATAVPAKKVAAAQRALIRLGAHVETNGRYTAATRKAVEKFQRDNGLPVTGDLTPKLRRFLALQAGTPEN